MIILNIYAITVIIAIITNLWMCFECNVYAKEHGIIGKKQSLERRISNWIKIVVQCFIPLYNIFISIAFLVAIFNENVMQNAINNCIEQGKLKYKDEGD